MVIRCEHVWLEVSNYIDGDVDPSLRQAIEDHVQHCKQCKAVLNGMRNVVRLYGDDRLVELPAGFSHRLRLKLQSQIAGGRVGRMERWSGWAVAAAAAILLAGGLWMMRPANRPVSPKSPLAKPAKDIPPELLVAVSGSSRVFHLPECGLIQGKKDLKTMKAADAIQQGLVPCVQCLHQYLSRARGRIRHERPVDLSEVEGLDVKLPDGEPTGRSTSSVQE
jgi:Putative zinc-finger